MYDVLRGSYALELKATFALLWLWSCTFLCSISLIFLVHSVFLAFYFYFSTPISKPPGPRLRGLYRTPSWPDKTWHLDGDFEVLSGEVGSALLTGEAAGRQTVSQASPSSPLSSRVQLSFNPSKNPNSSDLVYRTQQLRRWRGGATVNAVVDVPNTPLDAARKGATYFEKLQTEDGHWAGDYGGPLFLMPGEALLAFVRADSHDSN